MGIALISSLFVNLDKSLEFKCAIIQCYMYLDVISHFTTMCTRWWGRSREVYKGITKIIKNSISYQHTSLNRHWFGVKGTKRIQSQIWLALIKFAFNPLIYSNSLSIGKFGPSMVPFAFKLVICNATIPKYNQASLYKFKRGERL